MALIKCPECGREISDTAKKCPMCGYKMPMSEKSKKSMETLQEIGIVLAIIIVIGGCIFFYLRYSHNKMEQAQKEAEEYRQQVRDELFGEDWDEWKIEQEKDLDDIMEGNQKTDAEDVWWYIEEYFKIVENDKAEESDKYRLTALRNIIEEKLPVFSAVVDNSLYTYDEMKEKLWEYLEIFD